MPAPVQNKISPWLIIEAVQQCMARSDVEPDNFKVDPEDPLIKTHGIPEKDLASACSFLAKNPQLLTKNFPDAVNHSVVELGRFLSNLVSNGIGNSDEMQNAYQSLIDALQENPIEIYNLGKAIEEPKDKTESDKVNSLLKELSTLPNDLSPEGQKAAQIITTALTEYKKLLEPLDETGREEVINRILRISERVLDADGKDNLKSILDACDLETFNKLVEFGRTKGTELRTNQIEDECKELTPINNELIILGIVERLRENSKLTPDILNKIDGLVIKIAGTNLTIDGLREAREKSKAPDEETKELLASFKKKASGNRRST